MRWKDAESPPAGMYGRRMIENQNSIIGKDDILKHTIPNGYHLQNQHKKGKKKGINNKIYFKEEKQ